MTEEQQKQIDSIKSISDDVIIFMDGKGADMNMGIMVCVETMTKIFRSIDPTRNDVACLELIIELVENIKAAIQKGGL